MKWRSHVMTGLGAVAVVGVVQAWQTRHVPTQVPLDAPVQVVVADGRTEVTTLQAWLAAHRGGAAGLHVWADWCPICRAEEGSVTAVAADWPVLTLAMRSGDASQVATVLRQRGLGWSTVVDTQGGLSKQLGLQAVPAFLVVDADGRIRASSVGYTTEWGMRARLWWGRWQVRISGV